MPNKPIEVLAVGTAGEQQLTYADAGEDWKRLGPCNNYDPNVFFPTGAAGVEIARRICARCIVRDICLEHALNNNEKNGVWGGASERERSRILKARRTNSAA